MRARMASLANVSSHTLSHRSHRSFARFPGRFRAHSRDDDDDTSGPAIDFSVDVIQEFKRGVAFGNDEVKPRFTPNAIEHDRGLPIADALVATSAQVFVAIAALASGTYPSWLAASAYAPRWHSLPFVLPAVAHGAKLATIWVVGALAGKAYEREAFDGTLGEAVKRAVASGCFAVGLLMIVAQGEVRVKFAENGLGEPEIGTSARGDLILNGAASEFVVDCASEAVALLGWRVLRWNTSPKDWM